MTCTQVTISSFIEVPPIYSITLKGGHQCLAIIMAITVASAYLGRRNSQTQARKDSSTAQLNITHLYTMNIIAAMQ